MVGRPYAQQHHGLRCQHQLSPAVLLHMTLNLTVLSILQVYQLDGTELAQSSSIEAGTGFKCSTFGASSVSDPQLAVGSFDGKLQLWDLEHPKAPVWDAQAHASIVNGIDGFGGQVGVVLTAGA